MNNSEPKCPHCGSANVRMYDNESLEHPDKGQFANYPFDTEIYAMIVCDDCERTSHIVGDITWREVVSEPTAQDKETQAKMIRAYALVQVLEQTFNDLTSVWSDGGHKVDAMLTANYPFNESFDDLWVSVRRWMDAMPSPHQAPPPPPNELVFMFVDGKYFNEYKSIGAAVMDAYMKFVVDDWDYVRDLALEDKWTFFSQDKRMNDQNIEIMGESDYSFVRGSGMELSKVDITEMDMDKGQAISATYDGIPMDADKLNALNNDTVLFHKALVEYLF